MVPTVITTGSGGSSSSSQLAQSAQATSVQSNEWQGGDSKTPRLAAREVSLQSRGFDKEVIVRLTKPHAPSTELIYDGKWRIWTAWCIRNGVDCYNPPVAKVADFLQFLFNVQKVEYSTLAGYRSMLSGALGHTGLNLGQDRDLSDLMLSFKHIRPPKSRVFPDWDLSMILWTLSEHPFEPMFDEKVSLQFVTWKTAFLVLLAAGARRGEIHVIPYKNVSYDMDFTHVTLRPSERFITKTQIRTGSRPKSFRIPSLQKELPSDLSLDRKRCPCRAIKYYFRRVEPIRKKDPSKSLFFVSFDPRKKGDIHKNTVWLDFSTYQILLQSAREESP